MIFEDDSNIGYVFLPVLVLTAIYARFIKRDTGDPLRDKLKDLEIMLIGFGITIFIAVLALPSTPSLSTFGYPETLEDINSQKKMLRLFQEYNKAIVRTTDVVHWMLFIAAIWFTGTLYQLIKIMRIKREVKISAKK